MHYYLTYFLVSKIPCFTFHEARLIADANQATDENSDTSPGAGWTDKQQSQNIRYHTLHSGNTDPYLLRLQAFEGESNLVGVGRYLHALQDSYSHQGYTSPFHGHLFGSHAVDKTDDDVPKAMRMAGATWRFLNKYSRKKKCGCQGKFDISWWNQVLEFSRLAGGDDYTRAAYSIEQNSPIYLDRKRRALGVPIR